MSLKLPTKPEAAYFLFPTLCKVRTCPLNQAGIHHNIGIYKQDDVSPIRGFFSVLFGYLSLPFPFPEAKSANLRGIGRPILPISSGMLVNKEGTRWRKLGEGIMWKGIGGLLWRRRSF